MNELIQHLADKFYLCAILSFHAMDIKLFSLMMLVFLCIGCNKNHESSPTSGLVGKWHIEFHEDEFGGDISVEYSFLDNGELTLTMECAGERFVVPMLWRAEEGVLYAIEKDAEEFYEEENLDWTGVSYKINGNALEFYDGGKLTASFARKN